MTNAVFAPPQAPGNRIWPCASAKAGSIGSAQHELRTFAALAGPCDKDAQPVLRAPLALHLQQQRQRQLLPRQSGGKMKTQMSLQDTCVRASAR
ncbi:MAG: hypothetical protein RLZZ157_743 [Pseudomonadota bacterium]|jgi:hypothetical protein